MAQFGYWIAADARGSGYATRAVILLTRWAAQRANPVYRARYQYLTSREQNRLTPTQAQTVIAAAILRHLHAVITTGQAWDPVLAAQGTRPTPAAMAA